MLLCTARYLFQAHMRFPAEETIMKRRSLILWYGLRRFSVTAYFIEIVIHQTDWKQQVLQQPQGMWSDRLYLRYVALTLVCMRNLEIPMWSS